MWRRVGQVEITISPLLFVANLCHQTGQLGLHGILLVLLVVVLATLLICFSAATFSTRVGVVLSSFV